MPRSGKVEVVARQDRRAGVRRAAVGAHVRRLHPPGFDRSGQGRQAPAERATSPTSPRHPATCAKGLRRPTTSPACETDTVIYVPTPLTESLEPDLAYVVKSAEAVARTLRPGQLVVLESTTCGTTRKVVLPILEATGLPGRTDILALAGA